MATIILGLDQRGNYAEPVEMGYDRPDSCQPLHHHRRVGNGAVGAVYCIAASNPHSEPPKSDFSYCVASGNQNSTCESRSGR